MKVLSVIKTSDGANWAFEQSKYLNEKGIEIVTVLPDLKGKTAKKYIKNNMKVIKKDFSLPIKKPWKIFFRIAEIRDFIKKENPDIIHTHFVTNILMLRIALKHNKTIRIFQVPGPLHLENKFFKWLDIITAQKCDYWIATCKNTYQIYEQSRNILEGHVFLNYYGGYGGDVIDLYKNSTGILHREFQLKDEDVLIGMVSYFYKPKKYLRQRRGIKGHEDFIDAISILAEDNPRIKGVIIGTAWENSQKYEQKVKMYAKKMCPNNIIFTGFRADLKKIYKELDVVVHPSHSENLGGAAESLAAGVPTVATKVGGFPDIVVDGKTGYLCEVSNPSSIAENIRKILSNKEKTLEMTKAGKKKIRDLLDLKKTSKKIISIYYQIIKSRIDEEK